MPQINNIMWGWLRARSRQSPNLPELEEQSGWEITGLNKGENTSHSGAACQEP